MLSLWTATFLAIGQQETSASASECPLLEADERGCGHSDTEDAWRDLQEMAPENHETNRKMKAAQASITALSILVALSAALIGFLASGLSVEFGYNATVVASFSLTLAIVVFIIALKLHLVPLPL